MLPIGLGSPTPSTIDVLTELQALVDARASHLDQSAEARRQWDNKTSSNRKRKAFDDVRATLDRLCVGARRCHYCEDSAADEIEHVRPKSHFPRLAFVWENYLFSCGPCNGPKGNQYGYISNGALVEIDLKDAAPRYELPEALVHPRNSDPRGFLELDLGGTTSDGLELSPTFEYLGRTALSETDRARSEFTIKVLGLNRQVLIDARKNAFSGFRARIREYVFLRPAASASKLAQVKAEILRTPHLTVFSEMRRQAAVLPFMRDALNTAPEILGWEIVPNAP